MRSFAVPVGRLAPFASANAPERSALFHAARVIAACSVPSAARLSSASTASGDPASVPCAAIRPVGAPGRPCALKVALIGPRGTPGAPTLPERSAATEKSVCRPRTVPLAARSPFTLGASTARSGSRTA